MILLFFRAKEGLHAEKLGWKYKEAFLEKKLRRDMGFFYSMMYESSFFRIRAGMLRFCQVERG